jgi:hypothetical protein
LPLNEKSGVLSTRLKSTRAIPPGTRDCFGNAHVGSEHSTSKARDIRVKNDRIKVNYQLITW